jgi:hypothetical protein
MATKRAGERFPYWFFVGSAAVLVFIYGVVVGFFQIFPFQLFVTASEGCLEFCTRYKVGSVGKTLPFYFNPIEKPYPPVIKNTGRAGDGLNLVCQICTDSVLLIKVMDMDGKTLNQWVIDWFKIWPDAKHVPDRRLPKSPPGTHIDAAILMENGDLVFTFAGHGLVRMDRDGEIVWRFARQTHHTIERSDDGNIWVCGQNEHAEPDPNFPNHVPPFAEEMILVVSPDGKLVREWSIPELLRKNGLTGLLYMSSQALMSTQVTGNVLHVNDVQPFRPSKMKEGFFKDGDVLVSCRNNNTVFCFNKNTDKIKFVTTAKFIRQHDPDFIDGNTFSVFDNHLTGPESTHPQSRIVSISAPDNTMKVIYEGTPKHPFYSKACGKHQWLPNGNLLITESFGGRGFEVTPSGETIWQYVNYMDKKNGIVGMVEEVQRIPPEIARFYRSPEDSKAGAQSDKAKTGDPDHNQDKRSVKK